MYLKGIKATGFKSFADKIDIEFTNGISGIVGPNGSGKSNVVDAVRWVLGEQSVKQLRGDGSMSDVIFSGSKSRRAANYASVTLIFDNKDRYLNIDFDEVFIKRTIYKSGDNEYLINNQKVRLKDILDLFMDTGASKESFNIISQGDVGNILSNKPEDRRIIFEEAAGVIKYKKRKTDALKKLEKTHDNMSRVNDIIEELNTSIEPLKKQSEDAKTYLSKKDKLTKYEISLTVSDIEKYNYEYKNSKEKIEKLTDEIASMMTLNSKEQAKIEKIKNNINNLNNNLYEKQKELVEISSKTEKLQGEKNLISERSKYSSKDMKLHDNILSIKEKLLSINTDISMINAEMNASDVENKKLSLKLNEIINKLDEVNKNKNSLIASLNSKVRNITELKHRKEILINSIDNNSSLPYGTKNVLNNIKLSGMHNVVAKLFETEEQYSVALDIALASSSSHIVCDDENSAKEAINYLKNNNLGRATFLPINVIKPRRIDNDVYNEVKNKTGFIDIASNLIKFDLKYKNIMLNLLGSTIVCDNIDNANRLSKSINNRYRVVTLSGEIVNVNGSITGGNIKKSSIISEKYELENTIKKIDFIQNEINELENKINEIDELYSNYDDKKKSLYITVDSNSELIKEKKNKLHELSINKASLEQELQNNENTINNVITDEEESILNEYYEMLKKRDNIIVEIDSIKLDLKRNQDDLVSD